MQKISPFLWFDKEAKQAAEFYVKVFGGNSKIKSSTTQGNTPSGTVEIVNIELLGQEFTLMSAGPFAKFNESISFTIDCADQAEVDHFWNALTADGGQESQCGWLKDKFGVSWQVVPRVLNELMNDKDKARSGRAMQAMLKMKKIIIKDIQDAADQK